MLSRSPAVAVPLKSQTLYIVLGAIIGLIGFPGIHNLYAGYTRNGLVQLICAWVSCGVLWIPIYIWTIVEVCTVTHDSDGRLMM
ncbi:MAG: NINE protein [Xanthomonadaceae bacterium]|nr:NINE protein [Xanthomonadaceae bacterium]